MDDIQQKRPLFALEPGQFSRLEGYSFLARRVDSASQVLYGLTIYDAKKANQTNVVNADSGTIAFSSDFSYVVVDLQSGEIHQMNKLDRGKHRVVSFSRHRILIPASGFQLSKSDEGSVSRGDREMSIADMTAVVGGHEASVRSADSVARHEAERHIAWVMGDSVDAQAIASPAISQRETMQRVEYRLRLVSGLLDAEVYRRRASLESKNSYLVEIHKKYAIPFACVVFFLVGGPLGIITRRGNLGLSAALTLAFYTFYWACLMLGEDLADHGLIPAWLGMWGANGILAIAGVLLIIRVTNENVVLSPWQLYLRRKARRLYASTKA
jgi:lipopolysaccharide export system permease protein